MLAFIFLLEHDLFGKPVPTFPDHALVGALIYIRAATASAKFWNAAQYRRALIP